MQSNELLALLKPFAGIANPQALVPQYRTLELTPDVVRANAPSMILEARVDLPLPEPIYVDTGIFLSVLNSLPEREELHMELKNGLLHWRCGPSSGRLATVAAKVDLQRLNPNRSTTGSVSITEQFKRALELGSTSCISVLTSFGMGFTLLDCRSDHATVYSCDDITLSAYKSDLRIAWEPGQVTVPRDACQLLSTLMLPKDGVILFDKDELFYCDNFHRLTVKYGSPLKYDYAEIDSAYQSDEHKFEIPSGRVSAFIRRATALAETKRNTRVDIAVIEGRLALSFKGDVAESDEYILVDNMEGLDCGPVSVDALRLARAMRHLTEVVVDHADRNVLVFRGEQGRFRYSVNGMAKK